VSFSSERTRPSGASARKRSEASFARLQARVTDRANQKLGLVKIALAETSTDVEQARVLFREYAAESKLDLCFQNFDQELAALPGDYASPKGRLLLAWTADQTAGSVALREFSPGVCEMKRLYVRPAFRGSGLGRELAKAIIGEAMRIGYVTMRLDTLARMKAAVLLYESLGFRHIDAYRPNPEADVVYMELKLAPQR
jgi:putative acetyltransferase